MPDPERPTIKKWPPPPPGERESARRLPVARISAMAALVVGAWLVVHERAEPHWRAISPGVEFAMLRGEPWCRRGSSAVAVLRLDPARATLRVMHYTLVAAKRPLDIVEWQRETQAVAVFNAGQFYPNWSYMGLLISSGRMVSDDLHPEFKAALVAGPAKAREGARARESTRTREPAVTRAIRILDLTLDPLDPQAPGWREVAQSFMLIDRQGGVRVRKTDRVANRTVVAEDRRGRILVFTTEGGYTLWDFAAFLKHTPLAVAQAMVMDGGYEAELCVRTRDFRYASFGRWDDRHEDSDTPGARTPLPAVIAVGSK